MAAWKVSIRETLADTETPVSAYHKLCGDRADSFLLESTETHDRLGRWSIIGTDPAWSLELWPGQVRLTTPDGVSEQGPERFFDLIRETVAAVDCRPPLELPAVGALVGYIGFDAFRLVEKFDRFPQGDLPTARLTLASSYIVFDHRRRTMILAALAPDEETGQAALERIEARLHRELRLGGPSPQMIVKDPDRDGFMEAVRRAKEFIRQGDIFQVVLADRFKVETAVEPLEVYRRLRVKSPSPYMFFLDFGDYQFIGSSPETLVRVKGDRVFIRPIAGTRGRSDDPERDQALAEELISSDKERAEHVMLVDLGRNDAGRVCQYGTVQVDPYMNLEKYSHVMHLVSEVQGDLRPECDAVDAFMAGFPAGTVSGAPKIRAVEIIDQLESGPRGPYAGAVGYFGPEGDMDTCIAIRMLLAQKGEYTVPVGAGIVADSVPEHEYLEIQNKAGQSLAALRAAAEGRL